VPVDPDARPPGLSSGAKWALALVGAVVVIVAFVVLRGDDDSGDGGPATRSSAQPTRTVERTAAETTPAEPAAPAAPAAPAVATIRVVDGKPKGGVRRITRSKGDRIRLRVVSDTADEVHVHGYDLKRDVAAGGSVTFAFPATIDGRFEVELERSGTQLAELDVEP
jgi:hypothetical protein